MITRLFEVCLSSRLNWLFISLLITSAFTVTDVHAAESEAIIWESEEEAAAAEATRVEYRFGVEIPMRDGVNLNATMYRPQGAKPLPVVLSLTPYISDRFHRLAMYFAQRGYVVAIVDSRGRGNSEGEFHPFLQDANDGHDIVEWLARHEWSNGKIAMNGGSYGGSNQWYTAKEFPDHLVTIIPTAPGFFGIDFPALNNVFRTYDMVWRILTAGVSGQNQMFADQAYWAEKYVDHFEGRVAFKDFDTHVGKPSPIYQRWMRHPSYDEYWASIAPTDAEFAKMDLPILSVTGAYDGDQPGTMEFYNRHMKFGSRRAKDQHFLVIGPWDHGGTRVPRSNVYGIEVGDKSVFSMEAFSRQWYDWTMKDGEKPEFLKDRIAYFVVGRNEWEYANKLEDIGKKKMVLFLDGNGHPSPTAYRSGALVERPPKAAHTMYYIDDPLDTAHIVEREKGRAPDYQNPEYVIYQDDVLAIEEDGLVFHSEPFAEDTEISGFVELELWLSMDVRDTDFRVSLFEVFADNTSHLLTTDIQRARYRHSRSDEELVTPGEIELYRFENFLFFSRLIKKGSRLRLAIDGNNNIAWQQNFNSGGVVVEETAEDAQTAAVTLYQDRKHRSRLLLPKGE